MKLILAAVLILALGGSGLTFVGCSPKPPAEQPAVSKYEGQLVRRPGDTPEDGKVYVVQKGKKRWIINGEWIPKNGYRWPDDVRMIPASELNAIPLGDPIQ